MSVWNIIEGLGILGILVCIVVLAVINERLRRALEWEKNTRYIRAEEFLKEEARAKGKPPCIHGNLCRAYMREAHCILRQDCPGGCEFYQPKEVSDELGQS